MRSRLRTPAAAVVTAVAIAAGVAAVAPATTVSGPNAMGDVEVRLAEAGIRVADGPVDVPASASGTCGMAIYDHMAGASGPATPRDAVVEVVISRHSDTEPRPGVLAPVTEGDRSAQWVFVPDDGTAPITYGLSVAPGGGWIVGTAGIAC